MPLPKFYRVVQDAQGNVVPAALLTVNLQGTGTLAPLWQDDDGTIPQANPMTGHATYGSFSFYVAPGHYDLSFTKPGYTFEPQMDVQVPEDTVMLGTMAQQNANAVAITGGTLAGLTGITLNGSAIEPGRLVVRDAPPGETTALRTQTLEGAGRHQLYCEGTASHYLNGMLGIQTLVTAAPDLVRIAFRKSDQHALSIQHTVNDTGPGIAILFQNLAGTPVGSITTTGAATSYNTSSDRRLKQAIEALPDALETIERLLPVRFQWRNDGSPGVGFLADEVQAVVPDAVTGTPDGAEMQGVDFSRLMPYVVAALQALVARVEALEAR